MRKKSLALLLVLLMGVGMLAACGSKPAEQPDPAPVGDPVTIKIAGSWTECRAVEEIGRLFKAKYPNCTIEYVYLQDYVNSIPKRMSGDEKVDMFFTTNITADSNMLEYVLDIKSRDDIDLSQTFDGLIDNFMFLGENGEKTKLYTIPLGAEMRGLYVNKTLLAKYNIAVPTKQSELLAACKTLSENGLIPMHGNPADFGQTLLYPWVCNSIANASDYQATYDKVNAHGAGVSEMFRDQCSFLYTLVENDYYDYKTAQGMNLFTETTDIDYARYFFNIVKNGEVYEKADDVGQVAFLPSPISNISIMDKTKEDYHSEIEYEFIPAPVGPDGGYAYLSPAHGISVNNGSENIEWVVKFLNFLFTPENNEVFCKAFNAIPNTKEAFSYITSQYDLPSTHISHLGQVTFDYLFYDVIKTSLVEISKGNNPKYMKQEDDGSTSLYPLDYYMEALEDRFVNQ